MSTTDETPSASTIEAQPSASSEQSALLGSRDLSDREAVIAVMVANGGKVEDIAVRLSLPRVAVEGHLHQALRVLDLADADELTYVIVAAHYNRNAPATGPGTDQYR